MLDFSGSISIIFKTAIINGTIRASFSSHHVTLQSVEEFLSQEIRCYFVRRFFSYFYRYSLCMKRSSHSVVQLQPSQFEFPEVSKGEVSVK